MAGSLDEWYLRLPPWAQNWALDLKGYSERRIRYAGEYQQFLAAAARRRSFSPEELQAYQLKSVQELVTLAAKHVPFYRELYAGGVPRVQTPNDVRALPIVEKALLRARNADFRDERIADSSLIRIKTTGTTGTPVTVYTTAAARQLNYAYYNDFLAALGLDPFGRRIVVGGRIIASATRERGPYWRRSRPMNTVYLSSYHISRRTIADYVAAINESDVEYFDAYPSSMWLLAELIDEAGAKVRSPKAIITSAETLYPEQRELIERVFGAPIYDQYGAAEMCMFVGQCRAGRYHARGDYGLLEIEADGQPAAPGQVGHVLCTGFVNPAMPLIRYRIGDMGSWATDSRCDCGLAAPVIEQIVGRQDDMIVCPDGRKVGRLSPVLKGFPVREAQYVQRVPGAIILRVVKEAQYDATHTEQIRTELRKRLGQQMQIDFEFVAEIPRGKGGKFRAVLSEIK